MALIPKTESAGEFRPISLCTFLYKIAAKVMATRQTRLEKVLPSIIGWEQGAYVRNRSGLFPVSFRSALSLRRVQNRA